MEPQKSIVELARSLGRVARIVEGFAWFVAICGVIAGVVIALRSTDECRDVVRIACESVQRHPSIGVGIGVAISAIVSGAILWTLGRLARVYSLDVVEP